MRDFSFLDQLFQLFWSINDSKKMYYDFDLRFEI